MLAEKQYLAVDSGGSKTIWVLLKETGEPLKKFQTAGLGAVKEGILPVRETVAEAFRTIATAEPDGIFLSLGGPNVAEVKNALENAWPNIPIQVEREACGDAMLAAAKFLGCSAVVMCGTGSVAVGDTASGRKYAGGWGPIYGDGGSGGGMGTQALRLFLRSYDVPDDLGELSALFSPLTEGIDPSTFAGRMELKRRALDINRRDLAALAPKIYHLAEKGDKTALSLYDSATEEIVRLALGVSDDTEDFHILLCGGFFTGKPLLLEQCRRKMRSLSHASLQYEPRFSPVVAAQMATLSLGGVPVTQSLFQKLLQN